jgi:hypothetical protein
MFNGKGRGRESGEDKNGLISLNKPPRDIIDLVDRITKRTRFLQLREIFILSRPPQIRCNRTALNKMRIEK